jgi:hypothetical protein
MIIYEIAYILYDRLHHDTIDNACIQLGSFIFILFQSKLIRNYHKSSLYYKVILFHWSESS